MKYILLKIILLLLLFVGLVHKVGAQAFSDTVNLPFKVSPDNNQPYGEKKPTSNVNLKTPSNITTEVEYDAENNQYILREKLGDTEIGTPYYMSFEEYQDYDIQKNLNQHWRKRYKDETFEQQKSLIPKINVGSEAFETIFGSSTIDIKPQGSAKLKFGLKHTTNNNPSQPVELQSSTTFDFEEEIQMNVTGKIGDNLEMKISYNTESSFDFENTMNLRYQGKEDDIIQKIEAGDVSMPLTTSLISGSQSLFGVLSELKFGNLYITSVFSQQEGETKTISVEGGAQTSDYEIEAVAYDENRHFFMSHYFREHYDQSLKNIPAVSTAINITKVEVWVTNTTKSTEDARNILAFMDLGEELAQRTIYGETESSIYNTSFVTTTGATYPDNESNSLYEDLADIQDINTASQELTALGLIGSKDFEKVEFARKLGSEEYTYDSKLGYISLNSALNGDEVLAVAYEYTISGTSVVNQVGEFSTDGIEHPEALKVKLLKGTSLKPAYPNWNLMMKNIYAIGAYQVNEEDFIMEIEYYDDETGIKLFTLPNRSSLPTLDDEVKDKKLLRIMELDNLDSNLDNMENGNGVFDFVEDLTISASKGRVIFPMLEPFGGYLREQLNNTTLSNAYVYDELYDLTQYNAEQVTSKNKFYLSGSYKSSGGSDIFLNSFNIPEGSVKVTAGGIELVENKDYTVDYNMGRVKIINESYLVSGTPLTISLESNSMFSVQSKTLMGTHLDYRFNDDFNLGATIMNLTERPLTEKVGIGEEPISNTIWGFNGSYRTDAPFITRVVDFLPFLETKEMSSITVEGEFAQLVPGHNDAVSEEGEAYIDDFEGSESSIDLRNKTGWVLASIPQMFAEASLIDNLESGFHRSKLAWYQIDPMFFTSSSDADDEQQENFKVYRVQEQDIYPNKDLTNGVATEISTLDLAFFPEHRGPYNYNTTDLQEDGTLTNTSEKWGGIMRELSTNDFEANNVEYIEMWMMDPFVEDDSANTGGKLYFNLGNVSEDILKDARKSYEHGMPTDGTATYDETNWARVPSLQTSSTGFVNDGDLRDLQDIGLDGLSSALNDGGSSDEQDFFSDYINSVESIISDPDILQEYIDDPSNDDYKYFRSDDYTESTPIIDRYLAYNNHEGNTPVSEDSDSDYNTTGQQYPDVEDINGDFTLSETESYFQYELEISPASLVVGSGYITDKRTVSKDFSDDDIDWYQIKIPISEYNSSVNDISDFTSIRFMRMFLTEWDSAIVLRFAKLELVRGEWRKYDYSIKESDEGIVEDETYDVTTIPFSVSSVNIEENGDRTPVNYVLPNGVDRQQDPSNSQLSELNEQSMVLTVDDLEDGYSKAVYKNISLDMRDYGRLKMYVHAEARVNEEDLEDDDVTCFVRLGTDFSDNYYEYEVPLSVTPWNDGSYGDDYDSKEAVWPTANNVDIVFSDLTDLKLARNAEMSATTPTASLLIPYSDTILQEIDDDEDDTYFRRITIKGNPNLAQVKTVMIGIRNPLKKYNTIGGDDGESKSAEIWVNELRLTDFDEEGGWAATGSMTMRLADFGTLSLAGSSTQAGFGGIEQTAAERSKDEVNQVDVAANLELGKFFPKEANVRIPMYMGYSRTAVNPEYNPLDEDITMEEALADPSLTDEEKEYLLDISQELTERKSLNFTNVGIGHKGKGAPKFYSPSNLSASYSYNEVSYRDVSTQTNFTKNYSGALNYVYNARPKNYQPFKKNKTLRKPALRLIGDLNFYLVPSQVSFQTIMNRSYNETLLRNISNPEQTYTPTYDKEFTWSRKLNLKYNLSKGLKFDYMINTTALIEEDEGRVDRDYKDEYDAYKEQVWESILSMGDPSTHNQKLNATYKIPINKIPLFSWVSATARYSSLYNFVRGSVLEIEDEDTDSVTSVVNNSINNSQKITLNGQLSMSKLYNKVGFIKKIEKKYKQSAARRNKPKKETAEFSKEGVRFTAGKTKNITHNLKTEEDIKVKVTVEGKPVKSEFEILNENRISITITSDISNALVVVTGTQYKTPSPFITALEQSVRLLTGVKQASGSYSLTNGSIVSGYSGTHSFGSLNDEPGLGFVFGFQDENLPYDLAEKSLIISDSSLISPYQMTSTQTVSLKATYQPFKALRVDFTSKTTESNVFSEYYFPEYDNFGDYVDITASSPMNSGTYSVDIWMLNTAFEKKPSNDNLTSDAFEQFKQNLYDIAWEEGYKREEVADANSELDYDPGVREDSVYPTGFSSTNADIAIPAFLSAYTGNKTDMNIFSLAKIRPAWRVKFDGLGTLKLAKKFFKVISISHGYNSSFTVSTYTSNVLYDHDEASSSLYGNRSWATGSVDTTLFIPEYDITTFSAIEQFVPMIGIDLTWKSNMLTKFEYKKTRALTMSLANNMLTEVYSWDYVFGTGYRFDDLKIKINKKPIVSDLNLRADLSIRDGMTISRDLTQGLDEIIAGQKVFTLKVTADYQLSDKLTMQIYFDHTLNDPKTSIAYRNSITNFGFMFQFSLAQ